MDDDEDSSSDEDHQPDVNDSLDGRIALLNRNDPSTTEFEFTDVDRDATLGQMWPLFDGLRQNTNVQKVDLFKIPSEPANIIYMVLLPSLFQANGTIRYVKFPVGMNDIEFEATADVLCNNNNSAVESLDLTSCNISGRLGGEKIARLIRHNRGITEIKLCGNFRFGPAGATRIARALVDDSCALNSLDLEDCAIQDEGLGALFGALRNNNSLTKINVRGCNWITEFGYRALASSLPCIHGLKEIYFQVSYSVRFPVKVVQEMQEGLQKNHKLELIDCNVVDTVCAVERRRWKTLCEFVGARNKMNGRLLDEVQQRNRTATLLVGARGGERVPIGLYCGGAAGKEMRRCKPL